jgi:hypothetical protein
MLWQILVAICTLLGGVAAGVAIYGFIESKVRIVYSGPKPTSNSQIPSLPTSSTATAQEYEDFRKELDGLLSNPKDFLYRVNELDALKYATTSDYDIHRAIQERHFLSSSQEGFRFLERGYLIVYTDDHRVGQKVGIYPQERWIEENRFSIMRPILSPANQQATVKRYRINNHYLSAAIFVLYPGDYIVLIGRHLLTPLFRKPTSVPVFARMTMAIYLR